MLITTSYFSNDALEYAERAGNIVLIDGERFAELMIENSVGVSVIDTYKLYRVDSDYFED